MPPPELKPLALLALRLSEARDAQTTERYGLSLLPGPSRTHKSDVSPPLLHSSGSCEAVGSPIVYTDQFGNILAEEYPVPTTAAGGYDGGGYGSQPPPPGHVYYPPRSGECVVRR